MQRNALNTDAVKVKSNYKKDMEFMDLIVSYIWDLLKE